LFLAPCGAIREDFMEKMTQSTLNPELVIGTTEAIDRMGMMASHAANEHKYNYTKQIQLVRKQAKSLCQAYRNCRDQDWCFLCQSGSNGTPFFRDVCQDCKLVTVEALIDHGLLGNKSLVQVHTYDKLGLSSEVDNEQKDKGPNR
jgi:hypothetical protein